jgi:hypothetical protein
MTVSKSRSTVTFFIWSALLISFCPVLIGQLTIEDKVPKNVPIKLEFVKADSPTWVRDLNIKVTNTGTKPIRFLYLDLVLDVLADTGYPWGFPLVFGNGDLYSTTVLANNDDKSIEPNETFTFKVDRSTADAWEHSQSTGAIQGCRAQLRFGWLNFGDGTGIKGGGTPFKNN